jgi:elongation factor P--(R)-beta-lysine ligase
MTDIVWRPGATLDALRARAALVDKVRDFFRERGVLEVDTPVLQSGANLDHGVIPFEVRAGERRCWLPTSPEHPLKRLLAAGSGAIWTLAPAFRAGELGRLHQPEFRMLEWYRPGWDDRRLYAEVLELLSALTACPIAHEILTYREAFQLHAQVDPFLDSHGVMLERLGDAGGAVADDPHAALDLLLATAVEPKLGRGKWTVITDYPPWASAQAQLREDERRQSVAARFEIYRDGIELANGYHELPSASDLKPRLVEECRRRGWPQDVRDARFEAAMASGIGNCAGVAVGFDRVVMIALGLDHITQSQAFPWDRA